MKNGWQTNRLGDFAEAVSTGPFGSILHKSDYVDDGVPLVNPINIVDDNIVPVASKLISAETIQRLSNYVLNQGDVVIARRGEIGRCAVVGPDEDGWLCGTGSFFVRPSPNLDSQFLAHLIRSPTYREQLERLATGATMRNLSNTALGDLVVSIPPLAEQRRIVGLLDEAFAGLATATANAEKNHQNARALFESHLQSVFTQRGNAWKQTTLGEEIDLLAGFAFKSARYTTEEKDIRLLRGDNIIQGSLRWDDVKRWPSNDTKEHERYWLREGDVVLAMDRPWVKAGLKHATIASDDLPCLLVQRTARLRGGTNLDNRFLKLLIGSSAFIRHILGVQTGIGVPHISGEQIRDFKFARPPLSDQRRIADELESLREESQRLASVYERKRAALNALKKSLLHQAFTGNL